MSASSASTSQSKIDLVIVLDADDLTMLSIEKVKNKFPDHVPASLLLEKRRRLVDGIMRGIEEDELFNLEKEALTHIEEDEALKELRVHWQSVRQYLRLINRTRSVAIFVLCEDGIEEGKAMLRISSLSSEIPLESLHSNDRYSERELYNVLKNQFGSTCKFQIVTSRARTVAFADENQLSKEVIKHGNDFGNLHDRWSAFWFPNQRECFQPSRRNDLFSSNRVQSATNSGRATAVRAREYSESEAKERVRKNLEKLRRARYGREENASKKRPAEAQGDQQNRKRKAEVDPDWHPSSGNGRGKKENRRRQPPK